MATRLEIEHLKYALLEYGSDVSEKMADFLDDTQRLKKRIEPIITENDDGVSLGILMPRYAEFVDKGRRPGAKMPPLQPIKNWAKEKGLPQFRDKKGRYISNNSRAFLIARSIARDGIKPRPFFHFLYDELDHLNKILSTAFSKDIAAYLEIVLGEIGTVEVERI